MLIAAFTFALASNMFGPLGMMPNATACTGAHSRFNQSPELHWTGAPAGTQSYVVTGFDMRLNKIAWVVFDIPNTTSELPEDVFAPLYPPMRRGLNAWGSPRYRGPCPNSGTVQRYTFTMYALDTPALNAGFGMPPYRRVLLAMRGHILNRAYLTGLYRRP